MDWSLKDLTEGLESTREEAGTGILLSQAAALGLEQWCFPIVHF